MGVRVGNWLVLWFWTRVVFGSGYLDRLVVFECKYFGGIYFNIWKTEEHDRFHTHAFDAISIMLSGSYEEEQLLPDGTRRRIKVAAPLVRWIPRTSNHRMLRAAERTMSITLTGPWDRLWSETLHPSGKRRFLTWGRRVVYAEPGFDEAASMQSSAKSSIPIECIWIGRAAQPST